MNIIKTSQIEWETLENRAIAKIKTPFILIANDKSKLDVSSRAVAYTLNGEPVNSYEYNDSFEVLVVIEIGLWFDRRVLLKSGHHIEI